MTSVLLLVEYSELGPRVENLVRKDLEFNFGYYVKYPEIDCF